jgi:hypothetical protein
MADATDSTQLPESAEEREDRPLGLSEAEARAYRAARMQGLCHAGALEVALGARAEACKNPTHSQ